MTALRGTGVLAASLWAALAGCRFDTSGRSPDDSAQDRSASDAAREQALDRGHDRPVAERQAREQSCLDGLDNDADGAIDCADPDCDAGHECAPQVPAAMEGYYRLRKGDWEATAPACADGSKAGIYASDPVPAACSSCTCGPLTGAECGYPPIHHWQGGNGDCSSGIETDLTGTVGKAGCTVGTATGVNAVKVVGNAVLSKPGSCAATGGELLAKKAWSAQLEVCTEGAVGGGCASGSVCLRKPAAGYEPKVCHRLTGGGDCGSWSTITGHADWKDERGCAACGCLPAGTTCPGGSYTVYGDNQSCDSGCNDPQEIKPDGKCHEFTASSGSLPYSVSAKKPSPAGGSCSPTGGQPNGGIKSTPVTYCCR